MLLSGCCRVRSTPEVCPWNLKRDDLGSLAPSRSRVIWVRQLIQLQERRRSDWSVKVHHGMTSALIRSRPRNSLGQKPGDFRLRVFIVSKVEEPEAETVID